MVQIQPNEKLHAACDECRTRKLKCSGEKQRCTRCKREKIECVFSPQKQMGRPRKRRRAGEADEDAVTLTEATPDTFDHSRIATFHDCGVITPPHFATDPPIDPSLWDDPGTMAPPPELQVAIGPCTCLSLMYLTLSELQSVPSFAFPQVVIPLRKAMSVLSDLIHCLQCPKESFSAIQNVQSIVALCKAIVERFHKVLMKIDTEFDRLQRTGEKKPFRIGDNSPENHHLHTGTLDCPMGFNIELEAKAWKGLAKAALRTEIYGNGSNPRPLLQLIKEAEERQKRWHEDEEYCTTERRHLWGERHPDDAKKNCEALGAEQIRRVIGNLCWE
ncbi:hypothetical protein EK21DRAFT_100723 [Setomelanomma holmii]|uniref:Zn(2)-C6 fungal-type domain-containing protein n=1 Tax=Setomelanomma holmii TaxID=210430 RepID=A0A9P4H995_9PLEO|nr:hypothetical protein EK21DRAFT_100723 [Setomelanomma holmii]